MLIVRPVEAVDLGTLSLWALREAGVTASLFQSSWQRRRERGRDHLVLDTHTEYWVAAEESAILLVDAEVPFRVAEICQVKCTANVSGEAVNTETGNQV